MTEVIINLAQLTEEQLEMFTKVGGGAAVVIERQRRAAFKSIEEALRELERVGAGIEQLIGTVRHTSAVKALVDLKALEVINRTLWHFAYGQKVVWNEAPAPDSVRPTEPEAAAAGAIGEAATK